MGDVIYSGSIFLSLFFSASGLFMITLLFIGVKSIWQGIKVKNSKLNTPNIINGCFVLFLSLALAISGFLTYLGGERNVTVHLDDKNIYYGKSNSYLVHSNTGYEFLVSSDAYYQMQIGYCYSFTYYIAQGLLNYLQDSYLVTNIAQVTC